MHDAVNNLTALYLKTMPVTNSSAGILFMLTNSEVIIVKKPCKSHIAPKGAMQQSQKKRYNIKLNAFQVALNKDVTQGTDSY